MYAIFVRTNIIYLRTSNIDIKIDPKTCGENSIKQESICPLCDKADISTKRQVEHLGHEVYLVEVLNVLQHNSNTSSIKEIKDEPNTDP